MPAFIDITGQRFNRWTVLARDADYRPGFPKWRCICDCGTEVVVRGQALRDGTSKSCGCQRVDSSRKTCIERNTTHGKSGIPEFKIWAAMRQRCVNPKAMGFNHYGGRGIKVCERWNSFENFLADMGLRPSPKHSIERRNNDGPYDPTNCIWATKKMQANNTSINHRLRLGDETLTVVQWAERLGIDRHTIGNRLALGWPIEKVLSPLKHGRKGKPLRT